MKPATLLILCGSLACLTTACRPEKTTREQTGSSASPAAPPRPMARTAPMDYSVPQEMARSATHPRPGPMTPPGDLKAALAVLDRILALQKRVVKLWTSLNSVADARRQQQALLSSALDVLKMTIVSMQKAVTLSKPDLKTFLQKQEAQRVSTRKMNEIIKAKQRQLGAQPGGKAFFTDLKKSATAKVQRHSDVLMRLGQKLLARSRELKR